MLWWRWRSWRKAEGTQKNKIATVDVCLIDVVVARLGVGAEPPAEADVEKGIVEDSGCKVGVVEDIGGEDKGEEIELLAPNSGH